MKIIRFVLLIANGAYLLLTGATVFVLLKAGVDLSSFRVIPFVMFGFVLVGNIAYILRCPPRTKHVSDRQLVDTF